MAASPDDLQDFYGNDLGRTRSISAVAGSATSSGGASDVQGALPPGKYLVQATPPGGTDLVYIDAVPYQKGDTSWSTTAAAAPAMPLIRGWVEIHVRKGHNDRIVARTTGTSTTTVFITQISRVTRKLPPAAP